MKTKKRITRKRKKVVALPIPEAKPYIYVDNNEYKVLFIVQYQNHITSSLGEYKTREAAETAVMRMDQLQEQFCRWSAKGVRLY